MELKHDIPTEEISVAAYYVWQRQYNYEILCWLLAERQLHVEKEFTKSSVTLISQLAENIFSSKTPYDILCWYIGLYNLFIKRKTSIKDVDSIFKR